MILRSMNDAIVRKRALLFVTDHNTLACPLAGSRVGARPTTLRAHYFYAMPLWCSGDCTHSSMIVDRVGK